MNKEMMDDISRDVEQMIQRTRPRFGDIVVDDINNENVELLKKAVAGDSVAKEKLICIIQEQRAQKRDSEIKKKNK